MGNFLKTISKKLTALIFLPWFFIMTNPAAAATFNADACPDLKSTACIKAIKSAIDVLEYSAARDMAEQQCDTKIEMNPSERLIDYTLTEQALGCYYLFVLERFLNRSLRALDAHDRAKRIAVFGCDNGLTALCEVLLGFVALHYDDLLNEVKIAIRDENLGKELEGLQLRSFSGGRELPKTFVESAKTRLLKVFADSGLKINPSKTDPRNEPTTKAIDVELGLDAGDLILKIKIYDQFAKQIISQHVWRTQELEERRRLFGVNMEVPALLVATRRVDLWEPDYNVQVGFGFASIANASGGTSDRQRLIMEIRAGERLGRRTWESGMILSSHRTKTALDKRSQKSAQDSEENTADDSSSSEEAAIDAAKRKVLKPYDTANAFYIYAGRHLFGNLGSYTGIRGSANLGIGGIATTNFMASSARLGMDFQFGRRMILAPTAYWVGASAIPLTDSVTVRTKQAVGGGFLLSFGF